MKLKKIKNKINIFDLIKKAYPIKSNINTLYTMYKVNITKTGENNANSNTYIRGQSKNLY